VFYSTLTIRFFIPVTFYVFWSFKILITFRSLSWRLCMDWLKLPSVLSPKVDRREEGTKIRLDEGAHAVMGRRLDTSAPGTGVVT